LKDVTTADLDAYREYAEGVNLAERGGYREAIPRFEKALELDPNFAMAMAKLSVAHSNIGHRGESAQYAERALEHVDRLTARESYYIEGNYYMGQERTIGRAIDAFGKAIELYPDHASARNNLALVLDQFERYQESLVHLQYLVDRRARFVGSQSNLASVYSALGRDGEALALLEGAVKANPDSASVLTALGQFQVEAGRPKEALETLRRAQALGPGEPFSRLGQALAYLTLHDGASAEAVARDLKSVDEPFFRFVGAQFLALALLERGRSGEALSELKESVREATGPGPGRAHAFAAHVLLKRGDAAAALQEAKEAQAKGEGNFGEWAGLAFAALAEERLGRRAEADRLAEELHMKAEALPTEKEKRRYHHLRGELLLVRGDVREALVELEKAAATLPPRGLPGPTNVPQHVPVWFSLGSAYQAAGDDASALRWFEKIQSSTTERVFWPIPAVRSLYHLAKIHEKRGDGERSREYFQRFYDLWKDGDLDPERVEEARLALSKPL
jgi:tetratricopeptide (TPR) repeat protein